MRAIILAAGEGTRLRPHTLQRPKCMVELVGSPLVVRQIKTLRCVGVEDVTLVTGYRAEALEHLAVPTRHNPKYASTNMVYSMMCAVDLLDGRDDVVVAYADIVYERSVIEALLACDAPFSTIVDSKWLDLWSARFENPLNDAETLRLDEDLNILELGKKPKSIEEIDGQYMGLIKFRSDHLGQMVRHHESLDRTLSYDGEDFANLYMTSFLQSLIDAGHPLRAVQVEGGWLEVDTAADLQLYEKLHRSGKLDQLCRLDAKT